MTVILRPIDVDGFRRTGRVPTLPEAPSITLPAAVELACTLAVNPGATEIANAATNWFGDIDLWQIMIAWLGDGTRPPPPVDMKGAPTWEVWAIETQDDVSNTDWVFFQDRFRRTATQNGFSSSLGAALSRALAEMADNVYQHSGARGITVFHFADRRVSWCVADVGTGVLDSLRSCERWAHIASARDALSAVWYEGATRRANANSGDGFRQVERSLAALNGQLRFRTGDAVLELVNQTGQLQPRSRGTPNLAGLQIAASCGLGDPGEILLTTYDS